MEDLVEKSKASKKKKFIIGLRNVKGNRSTLLALSKFVGNWSTSNLENPSKRSVVVHFIIKEDEILDRVRRIGLQKSDIISKIPLFRYFGQKAEWCILMKRYIDSLEGKQRENAARIWPRTWILPDEKVPKRSFKNSYLIFKPSVGAQGDGIYLIKSQEELKRRLLITNATSNPRSGVVQKYVSNPLLLNGFKFDFRLYIVYFLGVDTSNDNKIVHKAFLFDDGLVRFCTSKYEKPSNKNAYKLNSHLTNYSLNKYDKNFDHSDDVSKGNYGSKRTVQATLNHMQKLYDEGRLHLNLAENDREQGSTRLDIRSRVWESFKHVAETVIGAIQLGCTGTDDKNWIGKECPIKLTDIPKGFNVLGIDVLLKDNLEPVLLEVNCSPSLRTDTVYPMEGKFTRAPTIEEFKARVNEDPVIMEALMNTPKRGMRCLCRDHHRPHEHRPCLVDMHVKLNLLKSVLRAIESTPRAFLTTDRKDINKMSGKNLLPL